MFLAALLTVIGPSVNDSTPSTPASGAILILVSLYALGGDTVADFALALLIGILVGTYSSEFTASPIAFALEPAGPRQNPKQKAFRIHGIGDIT